MLLIVTLRPQLAAGLGGSREGTRGRRCSGKGGTPGEGHGRGSPDGETRAGTTVLQGDRIEDGMPGRRGEGSREKLKSGPTAEPSAPCLRTAGPEMPQSPRPRPLPLPGLPLSPGVYSLQIGVFSSDVSGP